MRKKLGRSTDLVKLTDPPTPDGALIFDRAFHSSHTLKTEVLEDLLGALVAKGVFTSASEEQVNFRLVLDEALVNAVMHGNKFDASKSARVRAYLSGDTISFLVEDEGAGFKEEDLPDPAAPENLLEESGRGVILIRGIMHHVSYWRGGSVLLMTKSLK
jgi:serine/threonine-protein kinase RsbW